MKKTRHILIAAMMLPGLSLAGTISDGKVWQSSHLQLELHEVGGVCLIRAGKSDAASIDVKLPGACQFHLNKHGVIREVKQGKHLYLMIESARKLPDSNDCETHLRAVRVSGKRWQLSDFQDKVASCPPFQWDAMVFGALFK
ncbi:hypothetical protein V8J88_08610 [Massilia sp. W12]|uniref:hypothetical protein n=1 Tax=Massilia sp. W12 TaxID=3126507 RepID=UPI0030D3D27D